MVSAPYPFSDILSDLGHTTSPLCSSSSAMGMYLRFFIQLVSCTSSIAMAEQRLPGIPRGKIGTFQGHPILQMSVFQIYLVHRQHGPSRMHLACHMAGQAPICYTHRTWGKGRLEEPICWFYLVCWTGWEVLLSWRYLGDRYILSKQLSS